MSQQSEHEVLQAALVRIRTIRTMTMPTRKRRAARIHEHRVEMAYLEGVLETLLSRRSSTIVDTAADRQSSGGSRSATADAS